MCSGVLGGDGLYQQTAKSASWCDFGTNAVPRPGAGMGLEGSWNLLLDRAATPA